jgi:hypothetical protein
MEKQSGTVPLPRSSEKINSGGLASVFLATDTKLDSWSRLKRFYLICSTRKKTIFRFTNVGKGDSSTVT